MEVVGFSRLWSLKLDDDLTKHVSLARFGDTLTIRVRFASDVVLQDDTHRMRTSGPIRSTPTNSG